MPLVLPVTRAARSGKDIQLRPGGGCAAEPVADGLQPFLARPPGRGFLPCHVHLPEPLAAAEQRDAVHAPGHVLLECVEVAGQHRGAGLVVDDSNWMRAGPAPAAWLKMSAARSW